MSWVLAVVGAAFAVAGHSQKRSAAKARNRAGQLRQSIADAKAAAERREIVRESRRERGRVENLSAQTGGQGSSSEASAYGTLDTQTGQNLNQSYVTQALSGKVTNLLGDAAMKEWRGKLYGKIGDKLTSFGMSGGGE